jgi:hypothetical protein
MNYQFGSQISEEIDQFRMRIRRIQRCTLTRASQGKKRGRRFGAVGYQQYNAIVSRDSRGAQLVPNAAQQLA